MIFICLLVAFFSFCLWWILKYFYVVRLIFVFLSLVDLILILVPFRYFVLCFLFLILCLTLYLLLFDSMRFFVSFFPLNCRFQVCENIAENEWEVKKVDPGAVGPYAFKGNQWVGFDDEQIAARKVRSSSRRRSWSTRTQPTLKPKQMSDEPTSIFFCFVSFFSFDWIHQAMYVRDQKLGGIMFWSIDNDDFRGLCNGQPYPLIESAKAALLSKSNSTTAGSKGADSSNTK